MDNLISLYEIERQHERVSIDQLTGVYNKPFFMDNMIQQVRSSDIPFDLVCLEMESYDLLFGRYGGETCDAFMSAMVTGLLQFLPFPVTMGRIDGAHVVFIMPSVPFEMHAQMMQNCVAIGKQSPLPFFTANAGVYPNIPKNATAEEIYNGCLMAIKGIRYKPDVFIAQYNDEIRQREQHLKLLESNMNTALREKQFCVYYQPKYNTNGDKINGAEALVRWIHSEMGFMNPGEFIPLFEGNGFIFELDKYVLETVCADLRKWLDSNIPVVPVSVNISQTDFDQISLEAILSEIVDKYNIPHEYIHFEITETADAPDVLKKSIAVNGMRALGFEVELDDFGTGYSTLSILRTMPIDVLKVDISLVRNMFEPSGKAILEGTVFTASRMNLDVVVEGIENEEQYQALKEICQGRLEPNIQGYYFSKPMPVNLFEEMLKSNV